MATCQGHPRPLLISHELADHIVERVVKLAYDIFETPVTSVSPVKAGDKVVNELRDRGVLADEDETWGHLDALPLPQLECLLIVAVERLQRCLKSRWKLKRIEFLAFAAPFRWHVLADVLPEVLD